MQQRYMEMAQIVRWCFMEIAPRLGDMSPRDSLLAAVVAVIWGLNFVVIDWGMHGVPPLLFAAIRFTAVVLPAVFLVPRPQVGWRPVVLVGVFMSMGQFGFLYASLHAGMPPGLAALVLQAQVIFTVVIAAGALRELPTARRSPASWSGRSASWSWRWAAVVRRRRSRCCSAWPAP